MRAVYYTTLSRISNIGGPEGITIRTIKKERASNIIYETLAPPNPTFFGILTALSPFLYQLMRTQSVGFSVLAACQLTAILRQRYNCSTEIIGT